MDSIIIVRGRAIRQNIHCSDSKNLVPILEIHNINAIQFAFGIRLSGSCSIYYDHKKTPDVWIETSHPIDIIDVPILPPKKHEWCISTHTGHYRSNHKRM